MSKKQHLIGLMDMMLGLTDAQKEVYIYMEIEDLEDKYTLALKEKNEEME